MLGKAITPHHYSVSITQVKYRFLFPATQAVPIVTALPLRLSFRLSFRLGMPPGKQSDTQAHVYTCKTKAMFSEMLLEHSE